MSDIVSLNGYSFADTKARDDVEALTSITSWTTKFAENTITDADDTSRVSDGHFHHYRLDKLSDMVVYKEVDGVAQENSVFKGSAYIPCPKHLFGIFSEDAYCYLHFYTLNNAGEYVINWDVFKRVTSGGTMNYIGSSTVSGGVLLRNIPDGMYMRVCERTGTVDLYGWDGEKFGMPVAGNTAIVETSGTVTNLSSLGYGSVVIPGKAKYAITSNPECVLRAGLAVKDGVATKISAGNRQFVRLPEGYDYFIYRIDIGYGSGVKTVRSGDLSDYVSIVCDTECNRRAETHAKKIVANAKKLCSLEWTPAANLNTYGQSKSFKAGVKYNGIPYGAAWSIAHWLGWHVSPHTFVNAAADSESILFKETVGADTQGPYYGIVCSSFATMAAGWPYPQMNLEFSCDPRVEMVRSVTPQIGAVWSDVGKGGGLHCVIPERVDYIGDDIEAVSVYESTTPLSMKTVRYSNIKTAHDLSGSMASSGNGWYNNYGAGAYHLDAKYDMSNVPYFDLNDLTITGGDARPYRGDKSTYTSLMDEVLINIKNANAVTLYLTGENGVVQSIPIAGATQVDVKPYLSTSGIYTVHTDTSAVQESFEYVVAEPLGYTVIDGVISFAKNDFWYAYCGIIGKNTNAYLESGNATVNVPSREDGDYSSWNAKVNFRTYSGTTAFYKGRYGAYAVPCVAA